MFFGRLVSFQRRNRNLATFALVLGIILRVWWLRKKFVPRATDTNVNTFKATLTQRRVRPSRGRGVSQADKNKPELWQAVEESNIGDVSRLIQSGHSVNCRYEGWTPLMKAAEIGHCEIMKILLEGRADLEATNNKGRTALSFAAAPSRGRQACVNAVSFLLDARANISHVDGRGETAKARAQRDCQLRSVVAIDVFIVKQKFSLALQ